MSVGVLIGWILSVLATAHGLLRMRRTSLRNALGWGLVAELLFAIDTLAPSPLTAYAALAGASGFVVAVLGARRPGVAAWNAVVAGLAGVLFVPASMPLLRGVPFGVDASMRWLIAVVLTLGVGNYLPTRFGVVAGATVPGLISLWQRSAGGDGWPHAELVLCGLPIVTWLLAVTSSGDRWSWFRDRWGVVWGQRLREQFNAAARHRGWGIELAWSGLRANATGRVPPTQEVEHALRALLRRFDEPGSGFGREQRSNAS